MLRTLLSLAIGLSTAAAAAAQTTPPTTAKPETYVSAVSANIPAATDKAAATVNGEMISMAEVKALLETRPYPNTMSADQVKALRQAAVEMLVDDVLMRQFLNKYAPKVLKECTLPLTGKGVVHRVITDLATLDVTADGLLLREVAPGVSAREVQDKTEPTLKVAPDLKTMFS